MPTLAIRFLDKVEEALITITGLFFFSRPRAWLLILPDEQVLVLKRVKGIHNDWITSIRNSEKSISDFSYSGPLTESILLGTLAIRTGKALDWDAKNLEIKGNAEAAALIEIEARKGWQASALV